MVVRTLHVGDDGWPLMGEVIGRGELIIMLHGGGPDHYSMRPLATRLAGRYRVALPDIRGYGAHRDAPIRRCTSGISTSPTLSRSCTRSTPRPPTLSAPASAARSLLTDMPPTPPDRPARGHHQC